MPGKHVTYELQYTGVSKAGLPYDNCTSEDIILTDIDNRTTPYTLLHCYHACDQRVIVDKCSCISMISNLILGKWPENFTNMSYCETIHEDDIQLTVKNLQCSEKVVTSITDECDVCKPKCRYLEYQKSHSESKWPSTTSLLAFYRTHVQNKPYSLRFKDYEDILLNWKEKNTNAGETLSRVKSIQLIEDNFVKITILANSQYFFSYESIPSLSATVLLSSLGGTLNLYAGITMIFIFEVLEFTLRLISKCLFEEEEQENSKSVTKIQIQPL